MEQGEGFPIIVHPSRPTVSEIRQPQKPVSSVELWEDLAKIEKRSVPFYDCAVAFGQGPVREVETKLKPAAVDQNVQINTWGATTGVAMGYLKWLGEYREAIFSGGKTGGEAYPSEAQLMRGGMEQVFGAIVSPEYIHTEAASTNTLKNFFFFFNKIDALLRPDRPFNKTLLVASEFHVPRIKALATLYNLHDVEVLSSEGLVRVMVHDPRVDEVTLRKTADYLIPNRDKTKDPRKTILDWLEARTDPHFHDVERSGPNQSFSSGRTHFETAQGEEAITRVRRGQNEAMFTEGLLTIPENWLGYLADIKSDRRLRGILNNIRKWRGPEGTFLGQVGINDIAISRDLKEIRMLLRPYQDKPQRKFVSLDITTFKDSTLPWMDELTSFMKRTKTSVK